MKDDIIIKASLKEAKLSKPAVGDEKLLIELAELKPLEYERVREAKAEALGVRVTVLDEEVKKYRPAPVIIDKRSGQALVIEDDVKWDYPVDGAELLQQYVDHYHNHVILPDNAAESLALWSVGTYCYDLFEIFPRVSVKSPVPRCGKTTLLDAGEMVCARVVNTANVSTSAMFRLVDAHRPTLLIDECDSFLRKNDELRGIINAGHKKGGKVIRTTGDDFEVRAFLCFAPAMLAGIGRLPDTIEDRSLEIMLVRALANERPYPITKKTRRQAEILRRKAARWIDDNSAALATLDPEMPDFLYNREADNWRPLFAIAQQVGGKFPAIVRQCARKMRRAADNDDALATLALLHIREFFDGLESGVTQDTHVRPISIVNDLLQRDDAAWMEVPPRGKELTTQRLGTLLREFKIKSKQLRNKDADGRVVRFYFYKDFEDAFERYLS